MPAYCFALLCLVSFFAFVNNDLVMQLPKMHVILSDRRESKDPSLFGYGFFVALLLRMTLVLSFCSDKRSVI